MKTRMAQSFAPPALALAAFVAVIASGLPAFARNGYVQDDASLFTAATVTSVNGSIDTLHRNTGKEIVVVTVGSLNGKDVKTAAVDAFSQQQVNGVLFFFAKEEKKDVVLGDNASRTFFKPGAFQDIHNAMRGYLRAGDADTAITTGVNLVIDQYRSHERTGTRTSSYATQPQQRQGGFPMGIIWLLVIAFAAFIVIRMIARAMSGPRTMPPGYGGGPGMGGPGYGGQGYGGGGFGGGGGGGSFFSGMLGGLGGAFLGNELFGRHDNFGDGGQQAGFGGDNSSGGNDNAGFQSDPGQADSGNMGGGDWGGGGGGDFGGGGGDSGGGGW